MATQKTKMIDADTKLSALALFLMAQTRYRESREFEAQLYNLLGYEADEVPYMGCLSDEICDPNGSFERALKSEGFVVAKSNVRTRRS